MKKVLFVGVLMGILFLTPVPSVQADSMRIQPLKVQASLGKGEKKKGFVDITNPTGSTINLDLYVNSFSQVDNAGNLKFIENEQIKKGVMLDFDSASVGPYQTLRLYYIVDGAKLPTGDVFASIFAETRPEKGTGTRMTVRVGTLLFIENQTKGARHTEISALDMTPLQVGDFIQGYVSVKNPAPARSSTGFFPRMNIEIQPWGGGQSFTGPLVFAGNTRQLHFELPSNQFGIYQVKVTANDAHATKIIFITTGIWKIIGPVLVLVFFGMVWLVIKYRLFQKLFVLFRFSKQRHLKP